MRLTDTCRITLNGADYLSSSWRCELRHDRGELAVTPGLDPRMTYRETAVMLVGPSAELAALPTPERLAVTHKGRGYVVKAILPRYRPGGRLHHISLTLDTEPVAT